LSLGDQSSDYFILLFLSSSNTSWLQLVSWSFLCRVLCALPVLQVQPWPWIPPGPCLPSLSTSVRPTLPYHLMSGATGVDGDFLLTPDHTGRHLQASMVPAYSHVPCQIPEKIVYTHRHFMVPAYISLTSPCGDPVYP
jgi:hypothetical protein